MPGTTKLFMLAKDERSDRDEWRAIGELPFDGNPHVALTRWFEDTNPMTGTYRAECPNGRAGINSHVARPA